MRRLYARPHALRRRTAEILARSAQRARRAMWIRAEGLSECEAKHIPLSFDPRPAHG